MSHTGGLDLLGCWKDRGKEERHLFLSMGGYVLAFLLGAAVMMQQYSAPTLLASLQR